VMEEKLGFIPGASRSASHRLQSKIVF